MNPIQQKIREISKRLLIQKQVDVVIGYCEGSIPLRTFPVFIDSADETSKLVWNAYCHINLSKYLLKRKEKLAIIAKGCDIRSIIVLLNENQLRREQLFIIGVPCKGMIDIKRLNETDFVKASFEDEKELNGKLSCLQTWESIPFDYLCASCKICKYRNPIIYDEIAGELVSENANFDEFYDVKRFESLSEDERWEYFVKQMSKCIRCYACRDVCPLCYCEECFLDSTKPQWIGRTTNLSDVQIFHLTRAYHMVGRCVACGNCARVCPMGVDIDFLLRKLEKDAKGLFGYEAGIDLKTPHLFEAYSLDDPNYFVK